MPGTFVQNPGLGFVLHTVRTPGETERGKDTLSVVSGSPMALVSSLAQPPGGAGDSPLGLRATLGSSYSELGLFSQAPTAAQNQM